MKIFEVPQNSKIICNFCPNTQKVNGGEHFVEKYAKIMHFFYFLKDSVCKFSKILWSAGEDSAPRPPRGQPPKTFLPRKNPRYATGSYARPCLILEEIPWNSYLFSESRGSKHISQARPFGRTKFRSWPANQISWT